MMIYPFFFECKWKNLIYMKDYKLTNKYRQSYFTSKKSLRILIKTSSQKLFHKEYAY